MKKGPGFGIEEALTAILVYLMKQKKRSRK
jgi:hypothetical protein